MDLKSFIKEGLIDICQGVSEAKKEIKHNIIAPSKIEVDDHVKHFYEMSQIEFDIATTVKDITSSAIEGKVKTSIISVVSAKITAKGNVENENQSITRIKFSVPVTFLNI